MDRYLRRLIYNNLRGDESSSLSPEDLVLKIIYMYDITIFKGELGKLILFQKVKLDVDINYTSNSFNVRLLCFKNTNQFDSWSSDSSSISEDDDGVALPNGVNSFFREAEDIFGDQFDSFESTSDDDVSSSTCSSTSVDGGEWKSMISYEDFDPLYTVQITLPNTRFFQDEIFDAQYKTECSICKLLCFLFEVNPIFVKQKLLERETLARAENEGKLPLGFNPFIVSEPEKEVDDEKFEQYKLNKSVKKILRGWEQSSNVVKFLSNSYLKTPLKFSMDIEKIFGEDGLIYKKIYAILFGDFSQICYMTEDKFNELKKEYEERISFEILECNFTNFPPEFCECPISHHSFFPNTLTTREISKDVNCMSLESLFAIFLFSSSTFFRKAIISSMNETTSTQLANFSLANINSMNLPQGIANQIRNDITSTIIDYLNRSKTSKYLLSNFDELVLYIKRLLSETGVCNYMTLSQGDDSSSQESVFSVDSSSSTHDTLSCNDNGFDESFADLYFIDSISGFQCFQDLFFDPYLSSSKDIYAPVRNGLFVEEAENYISGNFSEKLSQIVELVDTSEPGSVSKTHPLIQELNAEYIVFILPPDDTRYDNDTRDREEVESRKDFSRIASRNEYKPFSEFILNKNYRLSSAVIAKNYHSAPYDPKHYYTIVRSYCHDIDSKTKVCTKDIAGNLTYSEYESSTNSDNLSDDDSTVESVGELTGNELSSDSSESLSVISDKIQSLDESPITQDDINSIEDSTSNEDEDESFIANDNGEESDSIVKDDEDSISGEESTDFESIIETLSDSVVDDDESDSVVEEQQEEILSSSYYDSSDDETDDDELNSDEIIYAKLPEKYIRINIHANNLFSRTDGFRTRYKTECLGESLYTEKHLQECFMINKKTRPEILIYQKI